MLSYRGREGYWFWLLHRVSGVAIILFFVSARARYLPDRLWSQRLRELRLDLPRASLPRARTGPQRRGAAHFFTVSGVLLLVLAFGHLLVVHVLNNVDVINYVFVASRRQTLGWRAYDWLLLFLAVVHGQNGLRVLIADYVQSRGWRTFAQTAELGLPRIFLAMGTLTIVSLPFMPGLHSQ